jgi:hypothetical protein
MASYLKRTDYLQRLKTRELIYQDVSGAYPVQGAVGYFVDASGTFGTSTVTIDSSGALNVNTIALYPQTGMGTFASPIVLSDGQTFQAVGNKCFVKLLGDIAGVSATVLTPIFSSGKAIPVNYLIYDGGAGASITVSPVTLDLTLTLAPGVTPDASFAIVFL